MAFTKLPNEIVVCRRFRDLVAASLYLQYRLELDMCGYAVPSVQRTDLSLAETIDGLRKHRLSWQRTELSQPSFIPDIDAPQSEWGELTGRQIHFVNGTLAVGRVDYGPQPRLSYRIFFHQLASFNRGTESKSWHHVVSARILRCFAIQPENDLLVLLEETATEPASEQPSDGPIAQAHIVRFKLHMRTISTNEPHPAVLAANADIMIGVRILRYTSSFSPVPLRICGKLVAIALESFDAVHILVYNWLTGQQIAHLTAGMAERTDTVAFCLLSEDFIIIPYFLRISPWSTTLDNWSELPIMGGLDVYKLSGPLPPRHVVNFLLPAHHPNHSSFNVGFYCSSVPSTGSLPSQVPKIFESLPSDSDNLLRISISTIDSQDRGDGGALLIPSQAILSITAGANSDQNQPVEVPWETWSPHTIWLRSIELRGPSYDFVHGKRLVTGLLNGNCEFRVRDFHPKRVHAQQASTREAVPDPTHTEPKVSNSLDIMFTGSSCANNYTMTDVSLAGELGSRSLHHPEIDDEHVVFGLEGSQGVSESGVLVYSL